MTDLSKKQMALAQRRLRIIEPLLATPKFYRTQNQIKARADEFKVGLSSVYRWLDLYEARGLLSDLVRPRSSFLGRSKVSPEVEYIIRDVLRSDYLSANRIDVINAHEEIGKRCKCLGLRPPHVVAVRTRINSLPEALRIRMRRGLSSKNGGKPLDNQSLCADAPLSRVRVDQTKLDIVLLDEKHRRPLGRPYLTVAIDVYSRMVAGFYLSFESPSSSAVGMCIAHAVVQKDQFMASLDIVSEWPFAGKMQAVLVDNAFESNGADLKRACNQNQIQLEWISPSETSSCGQTERFLQAVGKRISSLPGTIFSDVYDREKFKSEKYSAYTLQQFKKWLTEFIVNKYHISFDSGINTSPLRRFEEGILGDVSSNQIGIGMPPRVIDERSFRIDFMPRVSRPIRSYGMRSKNIFYYHSVLIPWIDAKRLFRFHYDPNDLSQYYFWDPDLEQYFAIPYRDSRHPPISFQEAKEATRSAIEQGHPRVCEQILFATHQSIEQHKRDQRLQTATLRSRDNSIRVSQNKLQGKPALMIVDSNPFECIDEDNVEELAIDDDF